MVCYVTASLPICFHILIHPVPHSLSVLHLYLQMPTVFISRETVALDKNGFKSDESILRDFCCTEAVLHLIDYEKLFLPWRKLSQKKSITLLSQLQYPSPYCQRWEALALKYNSAQECHPDPPLLHSEGQPFWITVQTPLQGANFLFHCLLLKREPILKLQINFPRHSKFQYCNSQLQIFCRT